MNEPHDFSLYEPLTTREREILLLLAEILSDREIAERLLLGLNTVKWYNRQIFQKLGVKNRKQAAKRAMSLGLLSPRMPVETTVHNLPALLTPFVGRIEEQEEIGRLLGEAQPRLLTLLGPGGMGKTRLGLSASFSALAQFSSGVYFVSMAPLSSCDQLVMAISDTVGCPSLADERSPLQRLCDYLRQKTTLLVLDNFEHLLEGVTVVTAILQAAPLVRIIATSRERLNVSGEMVYPLAGLRYPETPDAEDPREYGAIQLFIQTAQREHPHFSAPDADIVRICQLVQGMPLAIELAAAWAGTLTASEIADEIARSADFLKTNLRDVPERLRSVRAVFEASWAHLSEGEKHSYAALSVFRGGFTRDAAQSVAGAHHTILAVLHGKALLWWNSETKRYYMHELLRQYAEERLAETGESRTLYAAHQRYFASFAERWTEALKDDQLNALERLAADFNNVIIAFERAICEGTPAALMPFAGIWYYYDIRGYWHEGGTILDAAIAALNGTDSVALARMLIGRAVVYERLWDFDERARLAQQSVEILQRLGEERYLSLPLSEHGISFSNADPAKAMALWRDAHRLALRYDDRLEAGVSAYLMGHFYFYRGQLEDAKRWLTEAHSYTTSLDNVWGMTFTSLMLGHLAATVGDSDKAYQLYAASLASGRKIGFPNLIFSTYVGLFGMAMREQDYRAARGYVETLLHAERAIGREAGVTAGLVLLAEVLLVLGDIEGAKRHLRDVLFHREPTNGDTRFDGIRVTGLLFSAEGQYQLALTLLTFAAQQPEYRQIDARSRNEIDDQIQHCLSVIPAGQQVAVAAGVTYEEMSALIQSSL